ncbi:MAG: magnesium transporter CorA family protein [Xanthobacteraceae bacterium]|nr:magnesium transporter CorA family protein [Xanthobacteraceae bacterium]QYK45617.1 MAG: magnesium transporter CorA family protein [Xanthobacteraceae bacterium]
MLFAHVLRGASLERIEVKEGGTCPPNAIWLDLVAPTIAEDKIVEAEVGISVPTREEMAEIEISSRLYIENGGRYMTATLLYNTETEKPGTTAITFILTGQRLVTVRYDEPKPFTYLAGKLSKACSINTTGPTIMVELLDAIIDRLADILEKLAAEVDRVSTRVFERNGARDDPNHRYQAILRTIGRKGDLLSKARESLVSLGRLVLFFTNEAEAVGLAKDQRAHLKSVARDISSLTDHAHFLANKITFLLDATLGMVSLEQNDVIKLFSVMAVTLMPPTLIASIYGMNFKHMPELDWAYGYPLAVIAMVIAAIGPYFFFKWKRWL